MSQYHAGGVGRERCATFFNRDGIIDVDHGYTVLPETLVLTPPAAAGSRLLNEPIVSLS